jgi:predicted esterase
VHTTKGSHIVFPPFPDRKLNVLVLHGTTMNGKKMKDMYKWKECGIEPFCSDIANFYYPTGPCIVSKNHAIWKAVPDVKPKTPAGYQSSRHWWTMKDKWKFENSNFGEARVAITKFVEEEVKGTIDVMIGYSQGAGAVTQVMNDLQKGTMSSKYLKNVRGVIFEGCPSYPIPLPAVGGSVRSLHCNGISDPLTSLRGAKKHAALFNDSTFFQFKGGHEVRTVQKEPIRKFLLNIKGLAYFLNPTDGNFGPTTKRALQQFLLSQEQCNGQKGTHLAALSAPVDGNLGPATVRALQQFLLDSEQGKIEIKRRDTTATTDNDWDTVVRNNFDLLKNVRCSDEIWQIKGITLEEALEKAKSDPEVKALHWYKKNGGDGRIRGVKGWYQGAGGSIGTVANNDWDTIVIK